MYLLRTYPPSVARAATVRMALMNLLRVVFFEIPDPSAGTTCDTNSSGRVSTLPSFFAGLASSLFGMDSLCLLSGIYSFLSAPNQVLSQNYRGWHIRGLRRRRNEPCAWQQRPW